MSAPAFRTLLKATSNGEKVVPLLRAALWDPDFPSFEVKVEGFKAKPPDGWFHPSTHPLWSERALYTYLVHPDRLAHEPFDPQSTIAVTAGSFFHSFTQVVLVRAKVLERQPERCPCGGKHPERAEVYLRDEEAGSRGHSDGVLVEGDGFEFKSMHPAKQGKIPDGAPDSPPVMEWLMDRHPDYYLQAQDYLRMSGRVRMVMVTLSLVYPFPMREIHIDYNPAVALGIRDKYLRVREAVRDQRPPRCECGPTAKTCVARRDCW